ncbi:MAG: phosphatase PAP2 family protein [Bacteroidia bacterium]
MPDTLNTSSFNRFSTKSLLNAFILLVIYCLWILLFVGLRSDHVFLVCFCLTAYFFHPSTRRFITAFFIFVIYWIVYDSMRICPNYSVNMVHIRQPYDFEKSLFGITVGGNTLTPNEFFKLHTHTFLDIISGIFYINWVPVPLMFAFYLLIKDKINFIRFSYAFVLANFIGFSIYYMYPAAPPWYVDQYGFDFHLNTPASTAGLSRFDDFFGISLFHSLYAKNANIFAAIPSLHAAYPVIVLYFGLRRRMGRVNILFFIFLSGIWFAAVYTGHHYIIDLLIGAACAILSLFLFEYAFSNPKVNKWFLNLAGRI